MELRVTIRVAIRVALRGFWGVSALKGLGRIGLGLSGVWDFLRLRALRSLGFWLGVLIISSKVTPGITCNVGFYVGSSLN